MKFVYVTFKGRKLSKADLCLFIDSLHRNQHACLDYDLYKYDYFRWKLSYIVRHFNPEVYHLFTNL